MEYNYVIFGSDWDLYKQSYSDIYNQDNVRYIAGPVDNKKGLEKMLCKLHFSAALYNHINVPGKSFWNSSYFKDDFQTKRPLCFIFNGGWLEFDNYGLFDYLLIIPSKTVMSISWEKQRIDCQKSLVLMKGYVLLA